MTPGSADAQILAVRCLNETRLSHPPTYVATRFLVDSIASDENSSWSQKTIIRRYPAQVNPRFLGFQRFKKRLANGRNEYRALLVPSPVTCLAEALVLQGLSRMAAFRKPASVYSYCWPSHPACPYNFDHYANGYRRRNADISAALRSSPGSVAVITDIEKFYSSISHGSVRSRFHKRMDYEGTDRHIRRIANNLFEHMLSPFPLGKGIATGPEFSHLIGDLALSEIDEEFGSRFPGRYFRYVDDIVFVVRQNEKQLALDLLNDLLANVELTQNLDKADIVSSEEWLRHGPEHRGAVAEYSFEALVFRLKVFLALKPDRRQELESALQEHGFDLPIARLASAAGTNKFRGNLKMYHRRRWNVVLHALLATESSLVAYALATRMEVVRRLTGLFESGFPATSSRRRWHCQRLRYFANRALYVLPPSELGFMKSALVNQPEFAETTALLKLLQDGDSSELLEMPGPAVSAAAAILRSSSAKTIVLPSELSDAGIHSAATLLLYGVAEQDSAALNRSPLAKDAAALLNFCAGERPQRRERDDFGYLDEIRSLQLGRGTGERLLMLENRFSDGESVAFEALEIGEEYFT